MTKIRKWGGWSVLTALLLVLGLFAPVNTVDSYAINQWTPGETNVTYSENALSNSKWPEKIVVDKNDSSITATVFCLNEGRSAVPSDFPNRLYIEPGQTWEGKEKGSGETVQKTAMAWSLYMNNMDKDNNNVIPEDQADKAEKLLKKVLAYGYLGKDPKNLFPGYSDGQLYEITQAAVYQVMHFGNNSISDLPAENNLFGATYYGTNTSADDVKKLLEVAYDDATPEPTGTLDIYLWPYNGDSSNFGGQNLVGGDLTVQDEPEKPEIKIGTQVKSNTIKAEAGQTITDTVSYENLTAGKEYTLSGTLMDKKTEKEVTATYSGGTTTFTPDEANGSVDVEFTIDASGFSDGDQIVVFETLALEGTEVASHRDIKDTAQTVTIKEDSPTTDDDDNNNGNNDNGDSDNGGKGNDDSNNSGGVGSSGTGGAASEDEIAAARNTSGSGRAVKTGDETPLALMGTLALLAGGALLASRRKEN